MVFWKPVLSTRNILVNRYRCDHSSIGRDSKHPRQREARSRRRKKAAIRARKKYVEIMWERIRTLRVNIIPRLNFTLHQVQLNFLMARGTTSTFPLVKKEAAWQSLHIKCHRQMAIIGWHLLWQKVVLRSVTSLSSTRREAISRHSIIKQMDFHFMYRAAGDVSTLSFINTAATRFQHISSW